MACHHARVYASRRSRALSENQMCGVEGFPSWGILNTPLHTRQLLSRTPRVRMDTFCHWRRHAVCTNSCVRQKGFGVN